MLRWMVLAVLLVGIFPVRLLWAADATEGEIDFVPVWQEAQTVAAVEEKDVYLLQRSAKQCRRGRYDAALQDAEKAIAGGGIPATLLLFSWRQSLFRQNAAGARR